MNFTCISKSLVPLSAALVLACGTPGCKKDEIRAYEAPKDEPSPLASQKPPMPGTMPPESTGAQKLTYTKPDGWTEKPASSMRLASFSSAEKDGESADISVVALGGPAGGVLANVNRWRGQIGLEPVDDAGLKPLISETQIDGKPAELIDMAGTQPPAGKTKPQRVIAAMIESGGQTWFFKMTGEDSVVAGEKPAFIAFLNSVHLP